MPFSPCVRLEVLPKALYFRQQAEVAFYEVYFATVVETVEVSSALVAQAYDEAQRAGLAGMDALHIAAAKATDVTEFITVEKPTKPAMKMRTAYEYLQCAALFSLVEAKPGFMTANAPSSCPM
jgi:hypothetical protein